MNKRLLRPAILITVLAVTVWMLGMRSGTDDARRILTTCAKGPDTVKCYEREVPELYPSRSLPTIFKIVREIRLKDPAYQFCHVMAHRLGEAVVEEDPSKWIRAIPYNPGDGLCSNGFIHGVIIGRFRDSVLSDSQLEAATPDLKRACEPRDDWHPARLDQAICYHGMGHLFDYITDADLNKSLSLCIKIAQSPSGDFTEVCKGGVFMQIYQPLEPEDFALVARLPVKPVANNYKEFCRAFKSDSVAHGACLHEAWPLFRESILEGHGVGEFCADQPDEHAKEMCYETASSIVGRLLLQHEDKVIAACQAFPPEGRLTCFRATAQAVLEEDRKEYRRALDICARADQDGHACLLGLAQRTRFIFGDAPLKTEFCNSLPQTMRESCMQ